MDKMLKDEALNVFKINVCLECAYSKILEASSLLKKNLKRS